MVSKLKDRFVESDLGWCLIWLCVFVWARITDAAMYIWSIKLFALAVLIGVFWWLPKTIISRVIFGPSEGRNGGAL